MTTFKLKRLNLKHEAKFTLRPHSELSQTLLAMVAVKSAIARVEQKAVVQLQPQLKTQSVPNYIELVGQMLAQTILVSLLVAVPMAEAHAKPAKKSKIVKIVFDEKSKPASKPIPAVKIQNEEKVTRTLHPVDRYADDSMESAVNEDINHSSFDGVDSRMIASVKPRVKKPVRPDAGITQQTLNEAKQETLVQAVVPAKPLSKKRIQFETDLNLFEEYY